MTDQVPAPVPTPESTPAAPAYAAPPAYAPAPASTWNVLAIVSLVVSIVGFSWLSLGAVITGHIALSQIKKNPQQGRPLALAGTIIGYVGIVVTFIWVAIVVVAVLAGVASGAYNNNDYNY